MPARVPVQYYRGRLVRFGMNTVYPRLGVVGWGDSITGSIRDGGVAKVMWERALSEGVGYRGCGIGGENAGEILARVVGIQVDNPTTVAAAGTYRATAQERLYGREYAPGYEALRLPYRQTIARPHRIQWYSQGVLVGETGASDRLFVDDAVADEVTDTITAIGHPFAPGQRVYLFSESSQPGGIQRNTPYFVRNVSADAFQVSLEPAGVIVDITSPGAALNITGPYFLDFEHAGGSVDLSVRTFTDCSDLTSVFFAGTNDVGSAFAPVAGHLAAMIDTLEHDRWVVVTPLNNVATRSDASGSDLINYNGYQVLRAHMNSTYGARCVDIWQMFMDAFNPALDSQSEHDAGLWPARFRSDTIHPNATGEQMISDAIVDRLLSLGYWQ